jgi:surface antigen
MIRQIGEFTMVRALSVAICGIGVLLIGGCSVSGSAPGSGAAVVPAAGAPVSAAVLPTGAALGGILGGAVGAQLDEADRQSAYDAQVAALDAGERRTWRGAHGAFGYVEPGPGVDGAQGFCRPYAQTIYIGGRPQRGHGLGCRQPDGAWRMAS